jgi:hypothetical protein
MKTQTELGLGQPKSSGDDGPSICLGLREIEGPWGRRSRPQAKSAKAPLNSQAGRDVTRYESEVGCAPRGR